MPGGSVRARARPTCTVVATALKDSSARVQQQSNSRAKWHARGRAPWVELTAHAGEAPLPPALGGCVHVQCY